MVRYLVLLLIWAFAFSAEAATTFKIASLAPEGSTWFKMFKGMDSRLRELSGGRMELRIYAGGVAGDEVDVVRKMRVGQLQGGAITSVGLAEIDARMLVLQAPGLFESWEELDYARAQLREHLAALLREKGYVVWLWGDIGFNRIFSKQVVRVPEDLKATKAWCWTYDSNYLALFEVVGVKPIMLGVPEVLAGLQTGLIDSFSVAPLAAVSLQWFSRAKYMLDVPLTVTIGAIVLTRKSLDALSVEDQALLMQVGAEFSPKMAKAVRDDNQKSIEAIRKAGITIIPADQQLKAAWAAVTKAAADQAAGTVYPPELLAEVRAAVAAYRAHGGK